MKVSIKPPSTHTSNEVNIATAINNGTLSQSAQQANQQQLYTGQQPVYESTPQKNGCLTTNVQLKNMNYANNGQINGTESDSKKYRRISDKSQDHQRFFKNLVELPTN